MPPAPLPPWPGRPSPAGGPDHQLPEALPALGFALLCDRRFTPLEAHAHEWDRQAHDARLGFESDPRTPTPHWRQWWRHPAGILVRVDRYRVPFRGKLTWPLGRMHLHAAFMAGKDPVDHVEFAFDGAGARVVCLGANQDFPKAWDRLVQAQEEGRLLPFHRWRDAGVPPVGGQLDGHEHELEVGPADVLGKNKNAPVGIHARVAGQRRKHLGVLACRAWSHVEQLPLPATERQFWRASLADEVLQVASVPRPPSSGARRHPRLPRALPPDLRRECAARSRLGNRRLVHNRAALFLERTIEGFGIDSSSLDPAERAITRQWLEVLTDPRHPSLYEPAMVRALATPLAKRGVRFEHVLPQAMALRGVPAKLRWWCQRQDPGELEWRCRQPEADGLTLPMRLASAWLSVPNARVQPRLLSLLAGAARHCLEILRQRAPERHWVWSSARATVWDPIVNPDCHTSIDADLMEAHAQVTASWLKWAATLDTRWPGAVFVPGHDQSLALADRQVLMRALEQAGKSGAMLEPVEAPALVGLLEPAIALVGAQHLHRSLPGSGQSPLPSSRPRV